MTAEELSALIEDEIGEDERLHAILDRIREGKATFTDSELYAAITARITAQQMRRNVLSLDKREAAFVDITHDRYRDTFTVFSAVQRILDAENGIHIRPKEPGFDTGRAHKIGHALEDRTVPDSTIERRALSATENFCRSHHDDCVRTQAEFRARAGLQSYAIRDGSAKCCDWCADVSGKYPANETPQGFWGRHDNCKCSILYESKRGGRQLLRGTSKKWEQVKPGAGAGELHRLTHEQVDAVRAGAVHRMTHEQAMQIQQEKQLQRLTPGEVVNNPLNRLTNGENRAKIRMRGPILARKEKNVGAFSELEMPMQKRTITRICKLYGIDISGLRFKIQRDPHFLELQDDYFGSTDYDNIGRIDLFPKAFTNEEQLVRTILHEKLHVLQLRKHGKDYSLQNLNEMERQARKYENVMYPQLKKKVKR